MVHRHGNWIHSTKSTAYNPEPIYLNFFYKSTEANKWIDIIRSIANRISNQSHYTAQLIISGSE